MGFFIFVVSYVGFRTIPAWLSWIEYISWFKYANEALIINQWKGEVIECDSVEKNVTVPAFNLTDIGGGEIPSFNISLNTPCVFQNGDEIIDFLGFKEV